MVRFSIRNHHWKAQNVGYQPNPNVLAPCVFIRDNTVCCRAVDCHICWKSELNKKKHNVMKITWHWHTFHYRSPYLTVITPIISIMGPSINYVTPKRGRGGQAKRYHAVFLLLKLIKILTESVTWGGGGGQKWPILVLHNLWTAPIAWMLGAGDSPLSYNLHNLFLF